MRKFRKDIWKEAGWERGDQIPGGNQGHAFHARKVTDPPDRFDYVLKTLKRQDDPDRRAQFCAEIGAMGVLDHEGVVRVASTNAQAFREDVELYLITPRVNGPDLEAFVQQESPALEVAVRVVIRVLQILDHCHRRTVIHRDIKPCHVILRQGSVDDPVLIDFGLAYHQDTQPSDAVTEPGQGKGNRFLIGPEHLGHSPDANRNPASDICQCLGLLFFAVTKKHPGVLRDEKSQKPHQRHPLGPHLAGISDRRRNLLSEVFDTGFEWEPSRRWQTIDRLVTVLRGLLSEADPMDEAQGLELAATMRRAREGSVTSRHVDALEMARKLVEAIKSEVALVASAAAEFLVVKAEGGVGGFGSRLAQTVISFKNKIDGTRSRAISFNVDFAGNDQIEVSLAPYTGDLSIFPQSKQLPLGPYSLGSPEFLLDVRERVKPCLTKCVADVIGIDEA